MKFSTRQLVLIAVFGTLWGATEMTLGSVIKGLNLPFSGALLAALGLIIALTGRTFVPQRGATLFTGVIATLLKLFSLGGVVLGPMVGILAEALIAEIILSLFPRPGRLPFMLAAAAGVVWTMIQPFFTGALLFGRDLFLVWLDLLDSGARLLGLPTGATAWILAILVAIHMVLGAACGWLAWNTGRALSQRLPDSSPQTFSSGNRPQ